MNNEENNPFVVLSNLFVENQRQFNVKAKDLQGRIKVLEKKLSKLNAQLENDIFTADLIALLSVQEEAALILNVAKELEFQRDQIFNSVETLKQSKRVKLNK
jgi:hypothetical protein|tara:strand:+ start:5582 stop:5887 length:306 start_codon:yes stop_codon:yes gene_type:complete